MEERVNRDSASDEAKFKLLKDQLLKIQEELSSTDQAKEEFCDNKLRDLKFIENEFFNDVNADR